MKTYEVLLKAFCTVIVKAEDEESAMELAYDEVRFGDFEHDETSIDRVLNTAGEIEQAKRFANKVI